MAKKYGLPTNIGLIFIIVLVVVGLFSLTAVFAASESGLLGRHVDVEATAQLIRFQNRQAQLETSAAQELDQLESQIEQARQSLETFQKSVKTQTAQQAAQLAAIRQQVVDKQVAVRNSEATLIQIRQNTKADEETFYQDMAILQTDMEQLKAELLSEIKAIDIQLSAVQTRLNTLPTVTPTPTIHNGDDNQPESSDDKQQPSSDGKDSDSNDDKYESDDGKTEDDKKEDEEDKSKDKSEEKKEDDN